MQCAQCQQENPPQAKFCLECGTRLILMCVQCDTELPAGAKFCLECGQPVSGQPAPPSRFVSPEAPPVAPSRENTNKVTVLFVDVCMITLTPMGKLPPLVARLEKALPFRRCLGKSNVVSPVMDQPRP
jgi:hypothetical protein